MTAWHSLLLWLSTLATDPVAVSEEKSRCEAAVMAAYATYSEETSSPLPVPTPPAKKCTCNGTKVIKPDGSIPQPCFCADNCKCKPGEK